MSYKPANPKWLKQARDSLSTLQYLEEQKGRAFLQQIRRWVLNHPLECWRAQALCEDMTSFNMPESPKLFHYVMAQEQDAFLDMLAMAVSWGVTDSMQLAAWVRSQSVREDA